MKLTINDDPARGPKVEIEEDGSDMFVIVNSVIIARRGHQAPLRLVSGCPPAWHP